ncbi:hypothetical protein KKC1_20990 [Calderihabitans maritimus]|uniref:Uncharacterized protein n=1 Tax=Calderihabitans maritimus TaxID=1246530 RepID=A0A1Z5HTV2_9FIRM|nr:hypothetical protein KKC1_20990 [Calderihabitans maritimus]
MGSVLVMIHLQHCFSIFEYKQRAYTPKILVFVIATNVVQLLHEEKFK